MAHFEQFRHYHETFYAQVEALSVTPYSETALERGLMGVLVSAARVVDDGAAGVAVTRSSAPGEILEQDARGRSSSIDQLDRARDAAPRPTRRRATGCGTSCCSAWTAGTTRPTRTSGALVYERTPQGRRSTGRC